MGAVYVSWGLQSNAEPPSSVISKPPASSDESRGSSASEPSPRRQVAQLKQAGASVSAPASLRTLLKGDMIKFIVRKTPAALPDLSFRDAVGAERKLSDWRGQVVLLNLWATWCAPCRKEMPSLDRLKHALAGPNFDVVAVSIDSGSVEKPKKFLHKIGVSELGLFHDSSTQINADLKAFGMPTTVLIDAKGREIGRLVGPAEWDSEEAKKLIAAAIAARDE